jgi:curli biogenesis system outer membrane secretion channel CsgG
MKFRPKGIVLAFLASLLLSACVTPGTKTTVTQGQNSPTIDQAQAEAYNGPKARIAVAQFKDKTGGGWWTGKIGDGMADQMVTALFNTNRFIVLDRQVLDDVLTEQDLGASGRIRQDTAAPIGEVEGAELLIVGAVTEFEGGASGMQGGVGGIGGGVLGALAGGYRKAHMAIDVRIVDTRTSRIVAATSVEGEATDVNLGGLVGGYAGGGALAAGLGGWQNTPTEKALRMCINDAVNFIISKTPQSYYHYGQGGASMQAPAAVAAPASGTAATGKDMVREMQTKLSAMGYDVGTPDGVAGKKTEAAVRQFQQANGLQVTGQFNPATIQAIRAAQ